MQRRHKRSECVRERFEKYLVESIKSTRIACSHVSGMLLATWEIVVPIVGLSSLRITSPKQLLAVLICFVLSRSIIHPHPLRLPPGMMNSQFLHSLRRTNLMTCFWIPTPPHPHPRVGLNSVDSADKTLDRPRFLRHKTWYPREPLSSDSNKYKIVERTM